MGMRVFEELTRLPPLTVHQITISMYGMGMLCESEEARVLANPIIPKWARDRAARAWYEASRILVEASEELKRKASEKNTPQQKEDAQ